MALGAVSVAGFAPLEWFPVTPLALLGLFYLWREKPEWAAATGYAYGLGLFLAGTSWIFISLHRYGGMATPLAALAVLLLAAFMALFPGLAGYAFRRGQCGCPGADELLAATAWTSLEWSRTWAFTGFPWLMAGYSQTLPSPLAGYAPVLGVVGVTWVLALTAAGLAFYRPGDGRRRWSVPLVVALWLGGAGLTHVAWTEPKPDSLSVSLLQGNVAQDTKWQPEHIVESLRGYLRLVQQHPAQLVVLPETALPMAYDSVPKDYRAALLAAAGPSSHVVMGTVTFAGEQVFNAAVAMGPEGEARYAKSHLVPFGEYTPPLFQWTLRLLSIPMADFSRGPAEQAPLVVAGEKIAVNICYEDVFGAEIARNAAAASLLLNLSNTAWFGDSLAQPQHLQMARMRALETGRPMLRATNTGMTAVIGVDGRVQALLPPFTAAGLTAQVHGYQGQTPYLWWRDQAVLLLLALAWGGLAYVHHYGSRWRPSAR